MRKRGKIIIISGPSQVGKDSIVDALKRDRDLNLAHIVTYTTRPMRHNETNGLHYHFVSEEVFHDMRKKGAFLEYAKVHDYLFGSPQKETLQRLKEGKNVLLKIDVQGAKEMKETLSSENILSIFIKPQSLDELQTRLKRNPDISDEQLRLRLSEAKYEIDQSHGYDFVITNAEGKLPETIQIIENLLRDHADES